MGSQIFAKKPIDMLLRDAEGKTKLPRILGPLQLTNLGIGMIIGAGIFVTSGAAAHKAGPAIMISFIVAAFACALAGLCYAEFAAIVPVAGSAYAYSYVTGGELLAWIIGWDLILEYAVAAATVAQGASQHLQHVINVLPSALTGAPFDYNESHQFVATGKVFALPALILTFCVTVILILGLRKTARFNTAIVFLKIAIILLVIIIGAQHVKPVNWGMDWHGFAPFGIKGILAGASLVFFSFIGFDSVSNHAEDARRPQRDVPLGIIASLIICTILYIGVSLVLTGMLPYSQLTTDAPVVDALADVGQIWMQRIVALGAVIGIMSVMLATMLSQSRILLAMARDGLIPQNFFGAIHKKFETPWKSTIVAGVFVALLSSLLPLRFLLDLVAIGTLLAFVIVSVAVLILRRKEPNLKRPFRVPLFPVTPILSIVTCLLLMSFLSPGTWLRLIVWLLLGLIIYLLYGRKHSRLNSQLNRERADKNSLTLTSSENQLERTSVTDTLMTR